MDRSESPARIELAVETTDADLLNDIRAGLPSGVGLSLDRESTRRGAMETTFLYDFGLQLAAGVSAELLASFIMETIRSRAKQVKIGTEPVTSAEQCKRLVEQGTPDSERG